MTFFSKDSITLTPGTRRGEEGNREERRWKREERRWRREEGEERL